MGYYYKFDLRGGYAFSDNSDLRLRLKAGYSFKIRQFYFTLPVVWYFNRNHGGYLKAEIENGRHITNTRIVDHMLEQREDSLPWKEMRLQYFKNTRIQLTGNYDLNNYVSLQAGFAFHRRSAVNKKVLREMDMPTVYKTAGPTLGLTYRPIGWRGPILSLDYERGLKGFADSNVDYERWEIDGQYILPIRGLRYLSMRAGTGFYTGRSDHDYFLDYAHFRETNIPDGWYDEWTGDFEQLSSRWYNASKYYIRAHVTYEAPILFSAWIPVLGHFIEKERIYFSLLHVADLHPYTEYGYSVKTRLLSMGAFVGFKEAKYDGIGCKFEFELFRKW